MMKQTLALKLKSSEPDGLAKVNRTLDFLLIMLAPKNLHFKWRYELAQTKISQLCLVHKHKIKLCF